MYDVYWSRVERYRLREKRFETQRANLVYSEILGFSVIFDELIESTAHHRCVAHCRDISKDTASNTRIINAALRSRCNVLHDDGPRLHSSSSCAQPSAAVLLSIYSKQTKIFTTSRAQNGAVSCHTCESIRDPVRPSSSLVITQLAFAMVPSLSFA